MENYIAPEIPGYAQQVIKSALGARAEFQSIRWSTGGLYNKVYCVETTAGSFVFKIECDRIFPSTRMGQIENEVEGSRLLRQAGVRCPSVIAYDLTGEDIGVKYVLSECLSTDVPVIAILNEMEDAQRAEVMRQAEEIVVRLSSMTNSHFGSLTPSGPLRWHDSWAECYDSWFSLLIRDCVEVGVFTLDELAVVKTAARAPLSREKTYAPTFSTEDMGWHNMIWGNAGNAPDALYMIDFGNARYIPSYVNDYMIEHLDEMGCPPHTIPELRERDRGQNLFLLYEFEGMLWTEMMKRTEDYAHIRDWMVPAIEAAKKDASRRHVAEFVQKCRSIGSSV